MASALFPSNLFSTQRSAPSAQHRVLDYLSMLASTHLRVMFDSDGDGPQLNAQLEGWLSQVQSTKRPARAIIAPHAGYTYCGSCAAHAYKQVDPSITRRIFILGPSHHVPLSRCALSSVDVYRTPLYDLRIDQKKSVLWNGFTNELPSFPQRAITELQKNGMNMSFSFLNYAQSSQCRSWQDSS
ncbi:hypothetical protein A6R68_03042, partial [Neotoma lepida]